MLTYRLYHSIAGRLQIVASFDAADDAAAIADARSLIDGRDAELWQRGRLLGRISQGGDFTPDGHSPT